MNYPPAQCEGTGNGARCSEDAYLDGCCPQHHPSPRAVLMAFAEREPGRFAEMARQAGYCHKLDGAVHLAPSW